MLNRRDFVRLMAVGAASGTGLLSSRYAVGSRRVAGPAPSPTPTPTITQYIGHGNTTVTLWAQNYGPLVDQCVAAANAYVKQDSHARIQLEIIPYANLQAKMISSVAAGTDGDVVVDYQDWFLGVNISELFLNLSPYMGGRAELEKIAFPSALRSLPTPGNKVYLMPSGAGMRGNTMTVNVSAYKEKGIDYKSLKTFEDVVNAAKELTVKQGGKMTRAGMSPITGEWTLLQTWIAQQGGSFYNAESGTWKFSSEEGMAAAQRLYDLFWTDEVCSWDLVTSQTEEDQFVRGLEVTDFNGAWHVASDTTTNPKLVADAVPTPPLSGAKNDVFYSDEFSGFTLSRRLASDKAKRKIAIGLLRELIKSDNTGPETYSGTYGLKTVYQQPNLSKMKYGDLSKSLAEAVWPKTKWALGHVATTTPAITELESGLRKQTPLSQALKNIDEYMNQQEKLARQRIGLK